MYLLCTLCTVFLINKQITYYSILALKAYNYQYLHHCVAPIIKGTEIDLHEKLLNLKTAKCKGLTILFSAVATEK